MGNVLGGAVKTFQKSEKSDISECQSTLKALGQISHHGNGNEHLFPCVILSSMRRYMQFQPYAALISALGSQRQSL